MTDNNKKLNVLAKTILLILLNICVVHLCMLLHDMFPKTDFPVLRLTFAASSSGGLLENRACPPPPASSPLHSPSTLPNLPLPTSPSCVSLIKVKVAQGLLMLQMVAQVLTTLRSRNSLQHTEVIFTPPPFSISFTPSYALSFPPKMLFLH